MVTKDDGKKWTDRSPAERWAILHAPIDFAIVSPQGGRAGAGIISEERRRRPYAHQLSEVEARRLTDWTEAGEGEEE